VIVHARLSRPLSHPAARLLRLHVHRSDRPAAPL